MLTLIDLHKGIEIPVSDAPRTVLALGNFDGVHLGHRALLQEAVEIAQARSATDSPVYPGVWLFRTPPSDFLKDPPIPHLSTLQDKLDQLRACGIRYAFLGDFEEIGTYSPEAFAKDILIKACRCIHAVCGFNYSFGHRGIGTPEHLTAYFSGHTSVIPPFSLGGSPVSSTRIRALLQDGNVSDAEKLLGRPFSITAPVLHGKALGRTIDFPTLNQNFPNNHIIPKNGIYAVTVRFPWEESGSIRYGIANIGVRPTVEISDRINCETFILDYSGDLYGRNVEISFAAYLRSEEKFDSLEELKEAIRNDEQNARRLFGI
jgi:riboflavin kinase/FMN adenylyltransferase